MTIKVHALADYVALINSADCADDRAVVSDYHAEYLAYLETIPGVEVDYDSNDTTYCWSSETVDFWPPGIPDFWAWFHGDRYEPEGRDRPMTAHDFLTVLRNWRGLDALAQQAVIDAILDIRGPRSQRAIEDAARFLHVLREVGVADVPTLRALANS